MTTPTPLLEARFDEASRIAQRNGDLYIVAHAQLGLALLIARAGDATRRGQSPRRRGRHPRKARHALRRGRIPTPNADIAALRARLGDSAFERAYNAGRIIEASGEPAFA